MAEESFDSDQDLASPLRDILPNKLRKTFPDKELFRGKWIVRDSWTSSADEAECRNETPPGGHLVSLSTFEEPGTSLCGQQRADYPQDSVVKNRLRTNLSKPNTTKIQNDNTEPKPIMSKKRQWERARSPSADSTSCEVCSDDSLNASSSGSLKISSLKYPCDESSNDSTCSSPLVRHTSVSTDIRHESLNEIQAALDSLQSDMRLRKDAIEEDVERSMEDAIEEDVERSIVDAIEEDVERSMEDAIEEDVDYANASQCDNGISQPHDIKIECEDKPPINTATAADEVVSSVGPHASVIRYVPQCQVVIDLTMCTNDEPPQYEADLATPITQVPNLTATPINNTLLALMIQLILCSSCKMIFNRAVICKDFLIQLNKPIQCECGCVTCTLCNRKQRSCHMHNKLPTCGHVNTTASRLASCSDVENIGAWELERDVNDNFKTYEEVDRYVQLLMNETPIPGVMRLREAFQHLIRKRDTMSFRYWIGEAMPEQVANQYVCIPHVPGFWNHILVGNRILPKTKRMIGPDNYLPKLFNVSLGVYKFHWCCFVLKKQIILAMWCTSKPRIGPPKVFSLVDNVLKNFTASIEFRRMVFYLCRWFTAQYVSQDESVSPNERQLKVVLDCHPSEGSLVNIITLLASKCGMEKVEPGFHKPQVTDVENYRFNLEDARVMFTCPVETDATTFIDIVAEFNCDGGATGLTHAYTNSYF